MFAYCLNNPVNMFDFSGYDAIYISKTSGAESLPIVGHAIVFIQDSNGTWYVTQYIGPSKKDAKIETRLAGENDLAIIEKICNKENISGLQYTYIEGDFSKSVTLALDYDGSDYGGYFLPTNNCLHYVKEILSAGTFDDQDAQIYVSASLDIIPTVFHLDLACGRLLASAKKRWRIFMNTYLKKNMWWVLIVCIFCLLLVLYFLVLHPILGTPFMAFVEHRGIEYYTSGEYLDFEKGSLFRNAINSYSFLETCHVSDFYHADNQWKDSFIYGKKPDLYGIMLDPGDNYEQIRTIIAEESTDMDCYAKRPDMEDALDIYIMPPHDSTPSVLYVFIVGRNIEYLSFIMITDIEQYHSLIDVMLFWSDLPFDSQAGQRTVQNRTYVPAVQQLPLLLCHQHSG